MGHTRSFCEWEGNDGSKKRRAILKISSPNTHRVSHGRRGRRLLYALQIVDLKDEENLSAVDDYMRREVQPLENYSSSGGKFTNKY